LKAIHTLKTSNNYTHLLGGLLPIHSKHLRGVQGLIWGARGPFLPAAAMVVAVVMQVVFVLWLLKNAIKTPKLVVCKPISYYFLCILEHITIQVTLIVSWPEPNHFGLMVHRHIGYCRKALVMARTINPFIPTLTAKFCD
jgi:hypothetical protein